MTKARVNADNASADIQGVTAGTGLTGGGTSGTVTLTNGMATTIDAKGDLVGGTGADTFARLAVGANNTVLTADSAETTGLKWATPSSGMTLVTAQSFTTASAVNVNNCFSSTYQNYLINIVISTTSTGSDTIMRMRASGADATGSNYIWAVMFNNTSGSGANAVSNASATAFNDSFLGYGASGTVAMNATIFRPNEAAPTLITSQAVTEPFATYLYNFVRSGKHTLSTAYDGFSLITNGGTITGNLRVYGLAN